MMKLLPFELWKIWSKRSFQVLTLMLLIMNLFMLWYMNKPKGNAPPLSAYKILSAELNGMSENEKIEYITELKEQIEGVCVVANVMNLLGNDDEMSKAIAMQLQNENGDSFDKYKEIYLNGDYLYYTDSLAEETTFLTEIYNELLTVSKYEEYLDSVQASREILSEISIFTSESKSSFSSRNAEKSAEDHKMLSDENVHYFPSKGIMIADGNIITELCMLLSVFLFAGSLISEEKEKGLFYMTRTAKRGVAVSIGAKLLALLRP